MSNVQGSGRSSSSAPIKTESEAPQSRPDKSADEVGAVVTDITAKAIMENPPQESSSVETEGSGVEQAPTDGSGTESGADMASEEPANLDADAEAQIEARWGDGASSAKRSFKDIQEDNAKFITDNPNIWRELAAGKAESPEGTPEQPTVTDAPTPADASSASVETAKTEGEQTRASETESSVADTVEANVDASTQPAVSSQSQPTADVAVTPEVATLPLPVVDVTGSAEAPSASVETAKTEGEQTRASETESSVASTVEANVGAATQPAVSSQSQPTADVAVTPEVATPALPVVDVTGTAEAPSVSVEDPKTKDADDGKANVGADTQPASGNGPQLAVGGPVLPAVATPALPVVDVTGTAEAPSVSVEDPKTKDADDGKANVGADTQPASGNGPQLAVGGPVLPAVATPALPVVDVTGTAEAPSVSVEDPKTKDADDGKANVGADTQPASGNGPQLAVGGPVLPAVATPALPSVSDKDVKSVDTAPARLPIPGSGVGKQWDDAAKGAKEFGNQAVPVSGVGKQWDDAAEGAKEFGNHAVPGFGLSDIWNDAASGVLDFGAQFEALMAKLRGDTPIPQKPTEPAPAPVESPAEARNRKAEAAIDKFDTVGKTAAGGKDGQLGDGELLNAGVNWGLHKFLSNKGDLNGSLSKEELVSLQEQGLIEISDDGGIKSTEKANQHRLAEMAIDKFGALGNIGDLQVGGFKEIGVKELENSGVQLESQRKWLSNLGNGDGVLNVQELKDAQEQGLIKISYDGKVYISEKGRQLELAEKAVARFDGTGDPSYKGDQHLGKLELEKAGVKDLDENRFLRSRGNGDGFLNAQELAKLQEKGLIEIRHDGKITLTEEGRYEMKADLARSKSGSMLGMGFLPVFMGNRDGVLDRAELVQLQREGLVTISKEGDVEPTEKLKAKAKKAGLA